MLTCQKCGGGMYAKETRTSDTECIRLRVCNKCGRYMFTSEKEVGFSYGETMLRRYANMQLNKRKYGDSNESENVGGDV